MNIKINGDELTAFIEGRVDSLNAASVENEINAELAKAGAKTLVLDADKLDYISSAGLRVVLGFAKKGVLREVVNASAAVLETFSITGFTDIIKISKKLRSISIEGCEIIGKGGHGTVYRLDEETIVKLCTDGSSIDKINKETARAKKAFISGVPTAISYDTVKCGDSYGAVYEMINSQTLAKYLNAHPTEVKKYAKKYAELLRSLHTAEVNTEDFTTTKDFYYLLINKMSAYLTDGEVAELKRVIDAVPNRNTLIHNDFHPGNVMVQNGELLLIDMSDISRGNPLFDFAGSSLSMVIAGNKKPEMTKYLFGIEYNTCVQLWDEMIACYFGVEGKAAEEINNICRQFGYIKYSITPALSPLLTEGMREAVIGIAREEFFRNTEQIIENMKKFEAALKSAGI